MQHAETGQPEPGGGGQGRVPGGTAGGPLRLGDGVHGRTLYCTAAPVSGWPDSARAAARTNAYRFASARNCRRMSAPDTGRAKW
ncbi:hypothetical protein GCM10010124_36310 [Pilimelia terevasa]|uniref:Uncharacterized protein n=1 Tax=Pilimelia terevasa TaxID=53372 RepID=A0A8J3FJV1_9ACTN|nr:hypothetical protein GCM10010124_36310 [Pilimelia terevasa]